MPADERIKIFKNISRNYYRFQDHIKGIDDKIQVVVSRMENVHSIDYDKVPSGPPSFTERPMIELIEKKTALEKEKQYYKDLMDWVDKVVDSFDSASIKALIWMSCVQRMSLSSIAEKYNLSKDSLYKVRRNYLIKALDDAAMEELDLILENAPEETGSGDEF